MEKLAALIVDKRNLFFLLYIFAIVFCVVAQGWVKVENDITTYLPDDTETRQGLTVMDDNFVTYGTAQVMVDNITYDMALDLADQIENVDGVDSVKFQDEEDHYTGTSALFEVTFDGTEDDDISKQAMQQVGHLALDEGYIFGEEGQGYERINVAMPRSLVEEAMKRMEKAVRWLEEEHEG